MRYKTIADFNNIKSPYIIRPDQILRIPDLQHSGRAGSSALAKTPAPQPAARPPAANSVTRAPLPTSASTHPPAVGPTPTAHSPAAPAAGMPDFLTSLHALYYRDKADKPKTDVMSAMRAPWMKFAEEEFKAKVKRVTGTGSNQRILDYFKDTSFNKHRPALADETAWCAAFCNWCLVKGGVAGNDSAWAAHFKTWGRPTKNNAPALGAVAVIKFSNGTHHVTFVAGLSRDGNWLATLGGNQGSNHAVTHGQINIDAVVCYRYPQNYADNPEDYILHPVKNDGTVMTAASTH